VSVEQPQQGRHLARLEAGQRGFRIGGGHVERAGCAEIAHCVREVPQETFALVEDLLRRQMQLAALGNPTPREGERGLFPEQDVVQGRQPLDRADVGRNHRPAVDPQLGAPVSAGQHQDA